MGNFRKLNFNDLVKELNKYSFKQLHLHHTWKPTRRQFNGNNHIAMQQGMENYHVNNLGWQDIGQHLTLFPDGIFVTGRPFNVTPASIKGWNTGALAIEMIGNFDTPGTGQYNNLGYDELYGVQRQEVLKLIKWFGDKYGYSNIKFHREGPGAGKTCPGTSLDKQNLINEARGIKVDNKVNIPSSPNSIEHKKIWRNYINGSIVKDLQTELNRQFNRGLSIDGWFGQNTINALVNVRKGARGNLTRIIQRRLIAKGYKLRHGPDGIFGNGTYNAVVKFQRANKLSADGIVGKNTWKALFRK